MGAGETRARYRVELSPRARREFEQLSGKAWARASEALNALAENPRPHGVVKLSGEDAYRIRVGVFRIVYEIHDRILLVILLTVAHRKEAYRKR